MKRIPIFLTAATVILAAGCSSTKNTSSVPDDVYYSANDRQSDPQPASAVTPAASDYSQGNSSPNNTDQGTDYSQNNPENQYQAPSSTQQTTDDKGNTYITNNYNDDDYYDYQYSARLKRYYTPAIGYNYYDPFYTNSYWYDYNPYNYGVSIYLGYNWWAPSYCYNDPFWYGPVNPHFHNHFFGYYDSWNSPYGYYGYNNYWNGYNHGYHDGYWDGYYNGAYASSYNNPYYYNSYDGNATYYGPRGSISSNGKTTTPSPRATLGEKYQKAMIEQKNPVMDPRGVTGTQVNPMTGGGHNNTSTGVIQGTGKTDVSPIHRKEEITVGKNPVSTDPVRDPISVRNETGGKTNLNDKPKVDPTSYSIPGRSNTVGINQNPNDNGSGVRPNIEQPTRSNEINYTRPKNNDVTVNPRDNRGGTVRPQVEQPRNIQPVRPRDSQPGNNDNFSRPRNEQPRNNPDRNNFSQPRNENANPQNINPRGEPRIEQPRSNPSYDRPRQEMLPRTDQRQEPRQYKQEISQPRQKETISSPAPRQQNISEPAPRIRNSNNDNKGGGRRK